MLAELLALTNTAASSVMKTDEFTNSTKPEDFSEPSVARRDSKHDIMESQNEAIKAEGKSKTKPVQSHTERSLASSDVPAPRSSLLRPKLDESINVLEVVRNLNQPQFICPPECEAPDRAFNSEGQRILVQNRSSTKNAKEVQSHIKGSYFTTQESDGSGSGLSAGGEGKGLQKEEHISKSFDANRSIRVKMPAKLLREKIMTSSSKVHWSSSNSDRSRSSSGININYEANKMEYSKQGKYFSIIMTKPRNQTVFSTSKRAVGLIEPLE